MTVDQLINHLRRFDPFHEVVVRTHTGLFAVDDVAPADHAAAAVLDIRFAERVLDEPPYEGE